MLCYFFISEKSQENFQIFSSRNKKSFHFHHQNSSLSLKRHFVVKDDIKISKLPVKVYVHVGCYVACREEKGQTIFYVLLKNKEGLMMK